MRRCSEWHLVYGLMPLFSIFFIIEVELLECIGVVVVSLNISVSLDAVPFGYGWGLVGRFFVQGRVNEVPDIGLFCAGPDNSEPGMPL